MTRVPTTAGSRRASSEAAPTIKALSLGAGIQSSTCLLLAGRAEIPPFDVAIFADTGWEPQAVYRHLDRLERLAAAAGIPILRVARGNFRQYALDPAHRFASVPHYALSPRAYAAWRDANALTSTSFGRSRPRSAGCSATPTRPGYPAGVYAQVAIGISLDEVHRARDADVAYMRNVFPLLDLGWRREDCIAYLTEHGLGDTPRSSCLGCDPRAYQRLAQVEGSTRRKCREVWSIPTRAGRLPHFATFPIDLPLRCIAAGSPPAGVVLDPFAGISTTGLAALRLGRARRRPISFRTAAMTGRVTGRARTVLRLDPCHRSKRPWDPLWPLPPHPSASPGTVLARHRPSSGSSPVGGTPRGAVPHRVAAKGAAHRGRHRRLRKHVDGGRL